MVADADADPEQVQATVAAASVIGERMGGIVKAYLAKNVSPLEVEISPGVLADAVLVAVAVEFAAMHAIVDTRHAEMKAETQALRAETEALRSDVDALRRGVQ